MRYIYDIVSGPSCIGMIMIPVANVTTWRPVSTVRLDLDQVYSGNWIHLLILTLTSWFHHGNKSESQRNSCKGSSIYILRDHGDMSHIHFHGHILELFIEKLMDIFSKDYYEILWNESSKNIYLFYIFWWTLLTCLLNDDRCKLLNVQTLQLYRVWSAEWNFFIWIFRPIFWIDTLHSVQLIFSLFWWTFLTCLDKLLLIT